MLLACTPVQFYINMRRVSGFFKMPFLKSCDLRLAEVEADVKNKGRDEWLKKNHATFTESECSVPNRVGREHFKTI